MKSVDPMKKDLSESRRNMVKTSQNEKVNKGHSATWRSSFANFNGSKFVFHKAYNIPEMINHVGSAKKAQSTFEIFGKMT